MNAIDLIKYLMQQFWQETFNFYDKQREPFFYAKIPLEWRLSLSKYGFTKRNYRINRKRKSHRRLARFTKNASSSITKLIKFKIHHFTDVSTYRHILSNTSDRNI